MHSYYISTDSELLKSRLYDKIKSEAFNKIFSIKKLNFSAKMGKSNALCCDQYESLYSRSYEQI